MKIKNKNYKKKYDYKSIRVDLILIITFFLELMFYAYLFKK